MSSIPYLLSDEEIIVLTLQVLKVVRLRAESTAEGGYLRAYFPIVRPEALLSPNTQVIFGRNGTGKTHILRSAEELCCERYDVTKTIPVYFDMRDFGLSALSSDISHEDLVEKYYQDFISHIIRKISEFFEKATDNGLLKKWLGTDYLLAQSKIKKSSKAINKLFDLDNISQTIKSYVKTIKTNTQSKNGASISSKLSLPDFKPTADGSVNLDQSRLKSEDVEVVINGVHAVRFVEIVRELEKILAAVGAKSLVILIDEWSHLDIRLQPLFAELLKRTLVISSKIHIKIAAIKYQSRFSCEIPGSPQLLGLVSGIDITELIDLNKVFTYDLDNYSVKVLLTHILAQHVQVELDEIVKNEFQMHLACSQNFAQVLVSSIFDGEAAYDCVVQASEGNPRDFLAILSACCAPHISPESLPISREAAIQAAVGYFNGMKQPTIDCQSTLELFNKLFKHCVRQKSKVFFLSTGLCQMDSRVAKLWNYRFIHLIDSNVVIGAGDDVDEYCAFSLDYGKILTLTSTVNGKETHNAIIKVLRKIVSAIVGTNSHIGIMSRLRENQELQSHILALMNLGKQETTETVSENNLLELIADKYLTKSPTATGTP